MGYVKYKGVMLPTTDSTCRQPRSYLLKLIPCPKGNTKSSTIIGCTRVWDSEGMQYTLKHIEAKCVLEIEGNQYLPISRKLGVCDIKILLMEYSKLGRALT